MIDLDAQIKFGDSVDSLRRSIDKLAARNYTEPRYLEIPISLAVTSGQEMDAVCLAGPNYGRSWFVTRVVLSVPGPSLLPTAAPLYVGIGAGPDQSVGLRLRSATGFNPASVTVEWISTTFPASESWGREQFVVLAPNYLYAFVQQGASAVSFNMIGTIQVIDIPRGEVPVYSYESP